MTIANKIKLSTLQEPGVAYADLPEDTRKTPPSRQL